MVVEAGQERIGAWRSAWLLLYCRNNLPGYFPVVSVCSIGGHCNELSASCVTTRSLEAEKWPFGAFSRVFSRLQDHRQVGASL